MFGIYEFWLSVTSCTAPGHERNDGLPPQNFRNWPGHLDPKVTRMSRGTLCGPTHYYALHVTANTAGWWSA